MKRTVHFKVGISIEYDDEKSLRAAIKAVRDDLHMEQWSAGSHNFSIKLKSVRAIQQEAP